VNTKFEDGDKAQMQEVLSRLVAEITLMEEEGVPMPHICVALSVLCTNLNMESAPSQLHGVQFLLSCLASQIDNNLKEVEDGNETKN
jgi:hypothetical protein|tara:strand:+ start:19129 stop:19389 length:261 start_codon:yes stop_codon:yes gene_type:complete